MNAEFIKTHLEAHREVLETITALIPKKREFSSYDDPVTFTLRNVTIDEDGAIKALYARYIGCGDYEYETVYPAAGELFPTAAGQSTVHDGDAGSTRSGRAQS